MTKQVPDEALLRGHVDIEDGNKVAASIADLIEKNALSLCATQVEPQQGTKTRLRATHVNARMHVTKNRSGRIMHKLYDLEPSGEPEKQLNVNLDVDLYQMEDW